MGVVATAGHVDHGKSTLVRALTGQDPDRLEEEHERGLSIELGYCWTALEGVGDVAFVDVPGHERFLTTTLSGLGPVSTVMLVVAADDPWMPQAAEHLAAVDAFGISRGVLVVTRADLADPAGTLAIAREQLARTSLADAPHVIVSGRTGAGLESLRATLRDVLTRVTPDPQADVRLWVDRVFTVAGAGTVVTGTLPAGTVRVGDVLAAGDDEVKVRGLESLGRPVDAAVGPARVALRLGRAAPRSLGRGIPLTTPDAFQAVTELDVRLHGEGSPPERPLLHVGSTHQSVRFRPLGDRHARVRLEAPLPLRHGERVVLRDPGSRSLWGADVLDAAPPELGRRGAARVRARQLEELWPGAGAEVERRGVVRRSLLRRLGVEVDSPPAGSTGSGDWLVSDALLASWRDRLVSLLEADPQGLAPTAVARELGVPDVSLVSLLATGGVVARSGRLVLDRTLPAELSAALDAVCRALADSPFRSPDPTEFADLGLGPEEIALLVREGHLIALGDRVVLLAGSDDAAYDVLAGLPQPFTTSQARQALGTSRRVALALLAHLDRTRRTVRLPDDTRRVVPRQP